MYADDTTLSTTIDSTNENNCSTELINNELLTIHDWLLVNKLSLNVPKTKFMVFCMPQKKVVIPRLKIANTEIDSVDRFNFLGVLLDKHLSWDAHTNALVGKISRTTGILNKLKLFLPQYILKTIYTSLILCQLNYGILAWGHNNNRVYKLQKRAVRIISCSKFNAHSEPLLKQLNLLKVEDILKLQQLKFYHKLINRQLPGYFTCFPITVVPALGDPRRERPPAVCGHFVNVPTHFKVKLPVISGHLPNADADSHLLVVSTCYNGQCKQMPRFWWSFQPKKARAHCRNSYNAIDNT